MYPVVSIPVLLAYGARYAFEAEIAFYGVLLIDLLIGLTVYWVALESSVNTAEARKEEIVLALSKTEGPVGS
jgi:ABC-2 type transport system permease protein